MARRRRAVGLAIMAFGLTGIAAPAAEPDPLSRYRWTSRVLVISAPNATDPSAQAQRGIAEAVAQGMGERDLVTVEAFGAHASAMALRRKLDIPGNAFRAVLVGKDGGAKIVSAEPIPASTLFSTIDAMPMRRDEMRR